MVRQVSNPSERRRKLIIFLSLGVLEGFQENVQRPKPLNIYTILLSWEKSKISGGGAKSIFRSVVGSNLDRQIKVLNEEVCAGRENILVIGSIRRGSIVI